ncbi:hypothetical protein [Roseococcus suduntuyensis]|uniref:Uncharacterized protein n=1 Tax=Roseococcus suduntuyensis TaxID=455361 RepID=A0A840AEQ3_9PROT|nr:hypothetical protein [Roseococcus suduntuyensis]MBB3899601.1 hypothetical protein [Roseococcus suduntuyensis]
MALMAKARAMTMAQGAYDYVKARIHLGASNKILNPSGWVDANGRPINSPTQNVVTMCVNSLRSEWLAATGAPETTALRRLLARADMAEKAGCGNCGEQASLAFAWLMRHRATPLEFMTIINGDHAFCVLNRDRTTNPSDPDQWNDASVYIDPWRSLLSPGREMSQRNRISWMHLGTVKYSFQSVVRLE